MNVYIFSVIVLIIMLFDFVHDDILISSNILDLIDRFKRDISRRFRCRDLGPVRTFLGMNTDYDHELGTLNIDQRDLINKIACRFKVENSRTVYSPSEEKLNLYENENGAKNCSKLPYCELIGCLMYIMLGS